MVYQRILLKLSGVAFRDKNSIFNFAFASTIVKQIKVLLKLKKEVVVVLGGGNICRAKDFVGNLTKESQVALDYSGMLGTIINGLILKELFVKEKIAVGLLSSIDVSTKVTHSYNFELAKRMLKEFGVLLLVGGVGLSNFSTDFMAVLKAKELKVDVILFGKHKIDGIYSNDPKNNSQVKLISKISFHEVVKRKLKFIDIAAAAFGMNENIDLLVFNINKNNSILNVLDHKGSYSLVTNK